MSLFNIDITGEKDGHSYDATPNIYSIGNAFMTNPMNYCLYCPESIQWNTTLYLVSEITQEEYDSLVNDYIINREMDKDNKVLSTLVPIFCKLYTLLQNNQEIDRNTFSNPTIDELQEGKYYLVMSIHN